MKRFFTVLILTTLLSHSFQEDVIVNVINMDRVSYIVQFRRQAKEMLKQTKLCMDELNELIKYREESGHISELDEINHIILYYTMLEIENENDEKIDDCYSLDEYVNQCNCS